MRTLLFWVTAPLVVMVGVILLVNYAYAFTIPFTDIKLFETSPLAKPAPKIPELPVELEIRKFHEEEKNFFDVATRALGLSGGSVVNVTVSYQNTTLAILPPGTRFEDVPAHKYCLKYQYGTEQWFNCEQENFL